MSIQLKQINKSFQRTQVLNNIELSIPSGEMVALLGPSGSGKTTLLRIIAGLERQDHGQISFHGQDVTRLHPRDRHVGFMFQHYALFRHMTVFDNIAFGLTVLPRKQRPSSREIQQKVMSLLEMIQLTEYKDRYPAQLSGGQKQRIALARALAVQPQILLLDEPFGALDAQVRKELRRWLRQLHEELNFTSVFVTHDQEEAMEVADKIVVMSRGNIEQIGTPEAVWQQPESRFVLEFLGEVNQISAKVLGQQLHYAHQVEELPFSPMIQGEVDILLRPWEVDVAITPSPLTPLAAKVIDVTPQGPFSQLLVKPEGWQGNEITCIAPHASHPHRGERVYLGIQKGRIYQGDTPLQSVAFAQSA